MNISLNGQSLTIDQVHQVAHSKDGNIKLTIDSDAMKKMKASRAFVFDIVKKGAPVYGINTGFGALSSMHIAEKDLAQLQVNLIRSHCTGVGKPFSREITRAIMLLRANCLISGFSGVEPSTVELLLEFLNNDITPVVPEKGSVGASGDLAPLSHIALALIGEGEVVYEGNTVNSKFAISKIGKTPAVLGPKDGLALINGTACMAALGALAHADDDMSLLEREPPAPPAGVALKMSAAGVQPAYDVIWKTQRAPDIFMLEAMRIAELVLPLLMDIPEEQVRNRLVTEWVKREACWTRVEASRVKLAPEFLAVGTSAEDRASGKPLQWRVRAQLLWRDGAWKRLRAWDLVEQKLTQGEREIVEWAAIASEFSPKGFRLDKLEEAMKHAVDHGFV